MASTIGNTVGLPTLRTNANTLNTTMANIPQTYKQGTMGYDVNANQLARIVGQKSTELQPALTTANNAVASAQDTVDRQVGYGLADETKALLPYQSEQQMLSDAQARQTTGYTTSMGQELDALSAKVQAGVTLSEGERTRANQLLIAEEGYKNELAKATLQAKYMQVPYGSTVFNTSTGKNANTWS